MTRLVSVLIILVWAVQGCAANQARSELQRLEQHMRENTNAWFSARARLRAMCDIGVLCTPKLMKESNTASLDDWEIMMLPAYTLVVSVHEEELRRRHAPLAFEEYTLAAARVLAERADSGGISQEQLRDGFSASWAEMFQHVRNEAVYRLSAVEAARQADAETWAKFNSVASTLAVILTGVVVGAAAASSSYAPQPAAPLPQPVICQASSLGRNTVTGQSYGMTVICR